MTEKLNIPIVTDLIYPGDPVMKAKAEAENEIPSHLDGLKQTIDDIESAIGQDNKGPVGRAHAIRAEDSIK